MQYTTETTILVLGRAFPCIRSSTSFIWVAYWSMWWWHHTLHTSSFTQIGTQLEPQSATPALNPSHSGVNQYFFLVHFTTSCTIVYITVITAIFSSAVINGSGQIMMELQKHGAIFKDANIKSAPEPQTTIRTTRIAALGYVLSPNNKVLRK